MLTEKLQELRDLLNNTDVERLVPVHRDDLEMLVNLAEKVGLSGDVSKLLETFDATSQGYLGRIKRQLLAMNELIGRQMAVEKVLREMMKSETIHPDLITGFAGIISILRNGVKTDAAAEPAGASNTD